MIDFTKKGTKLPTIPKNIEYTVNNIDYHTSEAFFNSHSDFISYGSTKNKYGESYILAESKDYTGNKYYEIKISDIEFLANAQGMSQEEKITGYRCPMDLYGGDIKKGRIIPIGLRNGGHYKIPFDNGRFCQLPTELIESWEPVYEEMEAFLILGSSKIKIHIHIGKDFIKADGANFNISQLNSLISPMLGGELQDASPNSSRTYNFKILEARYKIGCSEFTLDDLILIKETYERINN